MTNELYLKNRIELIKKIDKNKNYKPTPKELKNAYGYLDYCIYCGKRILLLEGYSHGYLGNCHKFGCSNFMRFFSLIYTIFTIPIKVILLLLIMPFYMMYKAVKRLINQEVE